MSKKKKARDIEKLKDQFFSNVTHEFRTPLTLILGPVEQLLRNEYDPQTQQRLLMIQGNALQLQKLIDELLDISKIEKLSGVKVRSICADYFMEAPIHSNDTVIVDSSINILNRLIRNASLMNVKDIVIPCVEQSSLKNERYKNNFINNIKKITSIAEDTNINICLETDLAPKPFANMIDLIGSKNVTINYDIGNSAALGYDPVEEFRAYGDKISDLHIKDRLFGKGSVSLGEGNADLSKIFDLLSKYDYQGLLIFQAYRDNEGVEIFKEQLNWFFKNIEL